MKIKQGQTGSVSVTLAGGGFGESSMCATILPPTISSLIL